MSRPTQDNTAKFRPSVTIANGEPDSTSVDLSDRAPRGVGVRSADWSAWTSADIKLQVSLDDSTYEDCYDETGNLIKITGLPSSGAASAIFPAGSWQAGVFPYLRVVSIDTSDETDENQGDDRTLNILLLS